MTGEKTGRVEITVGDPPHAVITLEGTLVMVTYVPDKRIALVRCFAGVVTVASSTTGKSQQIRPSEWGIVWDSNDVERTGDDDMIRDLTRELGLWDRFSVVEQDASNFGPSGARLSSSEVPQVFVPQSPAECPPPATLAHPLPAVPADRPIRQALRQLQREQYPMGLVIRQGKPVGVITFKDLVEPIVGELDVW